MTCGLYRILLSRCADARRLFPPWLARHVEQCPACHRFAACHLTLARSPSVRSQAEQSTLRIETIVRGQRFLTCAVPRWRLSFALPVGVALGATAAVVIAVVLGMFTRQGSTPPGRTAAGYETVVGGSESFEGSSLSWAFFWNGMSQVLTDVRADPILREATLLSGDAATARDRLVHCLPFASVFAQ